MSTDEQSEWPDFSLPRQSVWKNFVQEIWMRHKDEVMVWEHRQVDYTLKDYYSKQKWFLRKQFRAEGGKVTHEE